MLSTRIQRATDILLDQAEEALTRQDWQSVAAAATRVLAVDEEHADAVAFLRIAGATSPATPPPRMPAPSAPSVPPRVVAPPATAPSTPTPAPHRASSGIIGTYGYPRVGALFVGRGALALALALLITVSTFAAVGASRARATAVSMRRDGPSAASTPFVAMRETPAPASVSTPVAVTTPVAAPPPPAAAIVSSAPRGDAVAPVVALVPPAPAARNYRGSFTGSFGTVVAMNGCTWDTPFQTSVDASVTRASGGALSGTAKSFVTVTYVVTNTPPGASCAAAAVSGDATGTVGGDDAQVALLLAGPRDLALSFSGGMQRDTLTGMVTMQRSLSTTSSYGSTTTIGTTSPTSLLLTAS